MGTQMPKVTAEEEKTPEAKKDLFTEENIILNAKVKDKTEAIKLAGSLLKDHGYIEPEYIDAMIQRDKEASVYLGKSFCNSTWSGRFRKIYQKVRNFLRTDSRWSHFDRRNSLRHGRNRRERMEDAFWSLRKYRSCLHRS